MRLQKPLSFTILTKRMLFVDYIQFMVETILIEQLLDLKVMHFLQQHSIIKLDVLHKAQRYSQSV